MGGGVVAAICCLLSLSKEKGVPCWAMDDKDGVLKGLDGETSGIFWFDAISVFELLKYGGETRISPGCFILNEGSRGQWRLGLGVEFVSVIQTFATRAETGSFASISTTWSPLETWM